MKLYNTATNHHYSRGFFLIELVISCCIFVVIATIISQSQASFYTHYKHASTRIQTATLLESLAEEYLQTGSCSLHHEIPISIKEIPVVIKQLPGKPIHMIITTITATTDISPNILYQSITTGIAKNNGTYDEQL